MKKLNATRSLLLALTAIVCSATPSFAETLNEVALFYRCYAHLTQQRPAANDALLAQVKAGSKTAIQACTEVLDRAQFTANGGTKIANDSDTVAKAVLYSLHQLHRTWSREQSLFSVAQQTGSQAWFEENPYGAYVTRALFSPGVSVDSVTQGRDYLTPVRVRMTPATFQNVPNANNVFRLGAKQPLAPQGELLGIQTANIPDVRYSFGELVAMTDFASLGAGTSARNSRTITNINFADVTAVRGPLADLTDFALSIRGTLFIPADGNYTFYLDVDDLGSVFIDGALVVNTTDSAEGSGGKILTAGNHAVIVQYAQRTAAAKLIMSWEGPGITKQVIPATNFANVRPDPTDSTKTISTPDLRATYFNATRMPSVRLASNDGGGFIGNLNYLLTTYAEGDQNFVPDGALKTNRSWSRAVLKDALCREIPVVRETDVAQFVVPTSGTPFRQLAACIACHASVDRQAGIIRGLRWNVMNTMGQNAPLPSLIGFVSLNMIAPTSAESTVWSDKADNVYGARAPYGHFFFRNFKGDLIDREVRSIDELSNVVREQDDYYTCFAKRYYQYFLGIDVELGDPGNPAYPALTQADTYHRSKVIDLGTHLKSTKSLRQLIIDIMSSSEYRMSDYGVTYQGSGQ